MGVLKKSRYPSEGCQKRLTINFLLNERKIYEIKDSIRKIFDFRYINLLDNNIRSKIEKADIILLQKCF
jgi:chemotaxis methyl-accepting protein methylase